MEQGKPTSPSGRDAPLVDPVLIRTTLAELQKSGEEFPIRVEGTHTLPYTSQLQQLDAGASQILLKLIRPLPHEMLAGAPFEMSFSAGDQRFTAPMTYLGRESYLLYRFTLPLRMVQSDRRRHKRYPFRPRERAYVLAQDAGLPGHGLAGPLVNLSLGGMAFRVDRILRKADNLCIPASVAFFERGKELPILKIRDLPKLPLFETRGIITYAWERNGEVILGLKFAELQEAETHQLQAVLDFRELISRNPNQGMSHTPPPQEARAEDPGAPAAPVKRVNPAGSQVPDALVQLGRRSTTLLLAMPPGAPREQLQATLQSLGYMRLQTEDSISMALERMKKTQDASNQVLVALLPPEPEEALASIKACQQDLGSSRELSVALLGTQESFPVIEDPLLQFLPWPPSDPRQWLPMLDALAGL